jgi:two-component system, NtrC family, nitrogen regulation sensor histidine kinase NtrY
MVKRVSAFARQFGLLVAIGITAAMVFSLSEHIKEEKHSDFDSFGNRFSALETQLGNFVRRAADSWERAGESAMLSEYQEAETDASFFLHVFRNDSLVFWNTNQLPVYSFAELHFPVEGIVRLQNGWYYSKIVRRGNTLVVGSFLVQHAYPYENEQLQNDFNRLLSGSAGSISLDPANGVLIRSNTGKFLFSIHPDAEDVHRGNEETWLFATVLLLALLIWFQAVRWVPGMRLRLALLVLYTALRFWCLKAAWLSGLASSELFDPAILALGEWTPNFGELIVSFVLFLLYINTLIVALRGLNSESRSMRSVTLTMLLAFPLLSWWMSSIGRQIVENSSIPLQLDQLFSLTRYSLAVLLMIGVAGFSYIVLFYELMRAFLRTGWKKRMLAVSVTAVSAVYVLFALWAGANWNAIVWPVVLNGVICASVIRDGRKWNFSFLLLLLLLFSVGATSSFHAYAQTKERAERELYANQLADDRDINTEIEYLSTKEKLLNEPYLKRLTSLRDRPNPSALKEALERRIFSDFWERYDIDFYYYELTDSITKLNGKRRSDFETLINRHGLASEMDSSMFLIKDYTSQYSYVIREQLKSDSTTLWLYCTLKSKKIPEEIGFPRLLISDKANVFESLGNYSIAKYYEEKLVNRYGVYSFPYSADVLKETAGYKKRFFNKGGFNHFMLKRGDSDMIILSKQDSTWVDGVTTMAFLFVSYGILLAVYSWLQARNKRLAFRRLSLAVKIQVVLVGLVFLSLLGFSIGSGTFVKNQYEQYTDDVIREKLRSVGTVGKIRLGGMNDIGESVRGDLEYYLRNWSQIFVTDVNVYDLNGQLVGSSRPKIYNIGLLSEQMNPLARKALVFEKKSEYIHRERIGKLQYLSGYIPFFNDEGRLTAYLNIQHFDQQNEFESQIQRFLVAIINVFMILLALSIVGAIFVSNWLTSPLRMIQRSFSRMELGKNNQAIDYQSNDELGDLVREYNQKLVDLETAAQKLAQSERESAWREMAKQVAHEIKNPLTPMKLTVQQLQRVFDPNDPNSKSKIDRVTQSVIEQIDALTSIANAFANFAKMPQPRVDKLEIRTLLESLVAVFESQDSCRVQLFAEEEQVFIQADREMLLRVLNNLITNGIQAIPSGREGRIRILLTADDRNVAIDVTDNGSGIPNEQLSTVFEPYFTTKSTGTGLGLAMVKQIVEGHGGTIDVKRTDASGTTMTLIFPRVL